MGPRPWSGRVFIGMSLDGYIARPDGSIDWLTDAAERPHIAATTAHPALVWETFFPNVDTVVMGRSTYETVSKFPQWPFANKNVIVLSSHPRTDPRVRSARTLDEAGMLLAEAGAKDVYIDGGRTIQSFLAAGLIDEITVSIAPVLLGRGRRLFGDLPADILLTLQGHHATAADGLVRATYAVAVRSRRDSNARHPL